LLVLVIDDSPVFRMRMVADLRRKGHETLVAEDGSSGLKSALDNHPDLVLVDQMMPELTGDQVVGALKQELPDTPAVIVTGLDSAESAMRSMKAGAFDYLTKPVDSDVLSQLLGQVAQHRALLAQNRALEMDARRTRGATAHVSSSPKLRAVYEESLKVAGTDATVLITGENGTGKEVLARWIQQSSTRADRPFVVVNCGALSESLFESELFGHVKGAFTGADKARRGYVEAADTGTLFLDEVAEIPPDIQVKLLRVLQEGEYIRLGETTTRKANLRILAATNRDLTALLSDGEMREDFYYRLNVFRLHLPPLRERRQDIASLFESMVQEQAHHINKSITAIDPAVVSVLERYRWPGNLRELRNLAERLVILCQGDTIGSELLPEDTLRDLSVGEHPEGDRFEVISEATDAGGPESPLPVESSTDLGEFGTDYRAARDLFERRFLTEQLRQHDGNMAATARTIGMHPVSLRQKVAKLGLKRDGDPPSET
jgi:DNA-binding NtrC family response regulator